MPRAADASGDVNQVFREKRYVFSGTAPSAASGYAISTNKRATGHRIPPFNIIAGLILFGIFSLLYIYNILTLQQLLTDINQLQNRHDKLIDASAGLQAEISQKADSVGKFAQEKLGLRYATDQPVWFELNPELLEKAEVLEREREARSRQGAKP